MNTTNTLQTASGAHAGSRPAILPALFAGLFGLFLLWGVGFSPMEAVHNAAHDTRHANAFPCH